MRHTFFRCISNCIRDSHFIRLNMISTLLSIIFIIGAVFVDVYLLVERDFSLFVLALSRLYSKHFSINSLPTLCQYHQHYLHQKPNPTQPNRTQLKLKSHTPSCRSQPINRMNTLVKHGMLLSLWCICYYHN